MDPLEYRRGGERSGVGVHDSHHDPIVALVGDRYDPGGVERHDARGKGQVGRSAASLEANAEFGGCFRLSCAQVRCDVSGEIGVAAENDALHLLFGVDEHHGRPATWSVSTPRFQVGVMEDGQ